MTLHHAPAQDWPNERRDDPGSAPRRHRDLIDPLADVDRQLLDEAVARAWAGVRPRPWPGRRAVLAVLAALGSLALAIGLWVPTPDATAARLSPPAASAAAGH